MTDTATLSTTENLFRIMAELGEAQQDVALLERLSTAQVRVDRLTGEQATAVAAQDAELAAEATATNEARFANYGVITVADKTPDEHVISTGFAITYTRLTYDMHYRENLPTAHIIEGFLALDDLTFDCLVEKHPEQIPRKIMALAPGDPRAAFERYFAGKRRGYLKGSLA